MAPGSRAAAVNALLDSFQGTTSFLQCPGETLLRKEIKKQAPTCVESGDCDSKQSDFKEFRDHVSNVDESLKVRIESAEAARKVFEQRVNDFRYAEMEGKGQSLADAYSADGPMTNGGSYIYALRNWANQAMLLNRACIASSAGCRGLMAYMSENPEADVMPGGAHGRAGSKVYNELRLACEVGRTRSPVPNDSPVWCDTATGKCEQNSCRKWWHQYHWKTAHPRPWVDDRMEYGELKNVCASISRTPQTNAELNEYHRNTEVAADKLRQDLCTPKMVEGYCSNKEPPKYHAECVTETGQKCPHGLVKPGSDLDVTSEWQEAFMEAPVDVSSAPPLLLIAQMLGHAAVQTETKFRVRQTGKGADFL